MFCAAEPAEPSGVLVNGRTANALRRMVLPPAERNGEEEEEEFICQAKSNTTTACTISTLV